MEVPACAVGRIAPDPFQMRKEIPGAVQLTRHAEAGHLVLVA